MKYTEQAVETLDDAGSVIANQNIEIEQLRQRVQELTAERDALKQQRDELLKACETYMSYGICEVTYYAIRNAIASVKEKQNEN